MEVRQMLQQALDCGASDIFIIAGLPLTYKVNGRQRRCGERLMPADTEAALRAIYALAGRAGAPLPKATTRTADGAAAELPLENGATLRLAAAPGERGWRFTRWQLDAPWQPDTSLDVWDGL